MRYFILLAFSLLMSCNQQDEPLKFCYIKDADSVEGHYVNYKDNYHDNYTTLKVSFKGGTSVQRDGVKRSFKVVDDLIGIDFDYVQNWTDGDIRITFDPRQGAYSNLGKAALSVNRGRNTMNLGWEEPDGNVAIHELMHFLNFLHEHQNPNDQINWNRPQVISDLSGPPNKWDLQTINYNVLDAAKRERVDASTTRDDESIMLYRYPCRWTLDGKGCNNYNTKLSAMDIARLQQIYPLKDSVPAPPPIIECPDTRLIYIKAITQHYGIYYLNRYQLINTCLALDIIANGSDSNSTLRIKIMNKLNQ